MSETSTPVLPPLPPPVGSAVRPSVSAGTPPPPIAPAPVAPIASEDVSDSDYGPPEWLREQRGEHRTSKLDPKFVILGVAAIIIVFVVGAVALMMIGIPDPPVVDVEPTGPLVDQPALIDS